MNLILISILAVASLSLLPTKTHGTTEVQEPPQALPVAEKIQPTNGNNAAAINDVGEIWQEDDREVLIRNERGTKNNGNGSGSGKRVKNNKKIKNSMGTTKTPTLEEAVASNGLEKQPENGDGKMDSSKDQVVPKHQKQQQHLQKEKKQAEQVQEQEQEMGEQNKEQHQTNSNKHSTKHSIKKSQSEDGSSTCRYVKSPWTECDAKTNQRSRTLTLKKGEAGCVPTRTIQKKCKKACRYEKGTWSECIAGQMSRSDKLKSTSDPTCQSPRVVNKNCNPGKSKDKSNKERKNKDKVCIYKNPLKYVKSRKCRRTISLETS